MYVSPQTLAMHLGILRNHFTFVHLDDWLESVDAGRAVPRRACAVTFDDGWRDNYDHAFPVLRAAQVPATIYLVSDLVGTRYSFWPNGLARSLAAVDAAARQRLPQWLLEHIPEVAAGRVGLDALQIDRVISACKERFSDEQMLGLVSSLEAGATSPTLDRDLMSWDEIREMQASGWVRFGSHTRRHTRLSRVASDDALRDEVLGSKRQIEEQLGAAPKTFCYPNGDISRAAIDCVRGAYLGAVTTASGWNDPGCDRIVMRRVGVHEDVSDSRASFVSRLVGVG